MKVAYVDSSLLVGLMFHEDDALALHKRLLKFDELISSSLLEAEIMSAAKREGVSSGITTELVTSVSIYFANSSLGRELDRVLNIAYLRGADAFHLACALALDPKAEELCFCSLDTRQISVAKSLGFKIV